MCCIEDCGEILAGQNDGFIQDDGTGDFLPDTPEDSDVNFSNVRFFFFFLRKQSKHVFYFCVM